ncbi:MAG: hypothetical protein A2514_07240 [Gammaproteobacteria bacterium RIFOXYD12_FULL_61_37]|nr:MAG: hypothetical protein A2514_07240 [Gammaproteobacteria bacterium RIFOXYD12_FULL_61_37]
MNGESCPTSQMFNFGLIPIKQMLCQHRLWAVFSGPCGEKTCEYSEMDRAVLHVTEIVLGQRVDA